jgi:4-amino-4-deoxy-L-arabinose transferase-like glycosyltransferase
MPADRRFMIILFAVALGIRVLFGITAESLIGVGPGTETRSLLYAEQIVSGVSWIASPVSSQSPGYPFLLAIFYLVAFKQIWLVFVLQSAMSALTVLLLYRMAVPSVGRLLAAVAALWLTLHYLHLQLTSIFVRDTLVVLLLLVVTCLLMRPFKRMRFAAFTGVSYAALLHVDPQYMLLFPVFAFVIFFKANRRFLNLQYLFVFITATMVVCLPWTIRNQVVYRQPIPFGLEAARRFNHEWKVRRAPGASKTTPSSSGVWPGFATERHSAKRARIPMRAWSRRGRRGTIWRAS